MSDGPLQSTMRELRHLAFAPRFWGAIAGVSLLLGLVGPFGTFEALRLPARLAYWAAIAVATYFTGVATVYVLARLFFPERPPEPLVFGLFGAVAGLPVALVVWSINAVVFVDGGSAIPFLPLLAYTALIAAIVSGLVAMFTAPAQRAAETAPLATTQVKARPRLLDRLPAHLRGRLLHLSMQDHYVEVHTDRGSTLLLMRLADAIAETDAADGLQIHRSHWVAIDAVRGGVRRDGRLFLRLENEAELPVSRSFLGAVRKAGLV